MKTKTLLFTCLLLGISAISLSAQDWPPVPEPTGTKSITFATDWWWGYSVPVFCADENGNFVQVDFLQGTAYAHCTWHYVDGVYQWARVSSHGEAVGESGEVFRIHEIDKEIVAQGINPWHYNFIGSEGTQYIGTLVWDFINDPDMENLIVEKAVCLEKKKK